MADPHVVWFADVGRGDTEVAGGKGASLGELERAGIPVPPGYIITTRAYRDHIEDAGIGEALHRLFHNVDAHDRAALEMVSIEARRMITEGPEPQCAQAAVAAYRALGDGPVAVRSSATAEDTEEASFAGQQSTYLNVEGAESLIAAVRACWASLFEPRAIYYRAQCGIDSVSVAIAVPVQRMVQSERSGVAFSVDPVTHAHDTIVVEAVRGLGEALVGGHVTPDMYVVDKETLTVRERTHVPQQQELVRSGRGGLEANEWRDVPAVRRRRPKLDDGEIARLADIVRRVERHYGAPQDVEWAEERGEFHIVQSRPITTMAHTH